jgi:hypothetical protein
MYYYHTRHRVLRAGSVHVMMACMLHACIMRYRPVDTGARLGGGSAEPVHPARGSASHVVLLSWPFHTPKSWPASAVLACYCVVAPPCIFHGENAGSTMKDRCSPHESATRIE